MAPSKKVDVISGANSEAQTALFRFLRALRLEPRSWPGIARLSQTQQPLSRLLLEDAFAGAQAIVVLLTDEDQASLNPERDRDPENWYAPRWELQPSQDTLFAAGVAVGFAPERTILVQSGRLKRFENRAWSREVLTLDDSIAVRERLISRLIEAGCIVETSNERWTTAGDFAAPQRAPLRKTDTVVASEKETATVDDSLVPDSPETQFIIQLVPILRTSGTHSVAPKWLASQMDMEQETVETHLRRLSHLGLVDVFTQIGEDKFGLSKAGWKLGETLIRDKTGG